MENIYIEHLLESLTIGLKKDSGKRKTIELIKGEISKIEVSRDEYEAKLTGIRQILE